MKRRRSSVVILLLWCALTDSFTSIDWCQYFRLLKRDHVRPECNGLYRSWLVKQRDQSTERPSPLLHDLVTSFRRFINQRASITEITKKALGIGTCSAFATKCRESKLCDPDMICHSRSGYCCYNNRRKLAVDVCNTTDTMHLPCYSLTSMKWCLTDYQCETTSKQKCCPTRCGYKICL